jgi:hypothetical protein
MFAHLVILWSFGIFSPVLVYCAKKNLATLSGIFRPNVLKELIKQNILVGMMDN